MDDIAHGIYQNYFRFLVILFNSFTNIINIINIKENTLNFLFDTAKSL